MGIESLDDELLNEIGAHIALSLTRMLQLPDPHMSADHEKENCEAN